jgi:hypothetical protein
LTIPVFSDGLLRGTVHPPWARPSRRAARFVLLVLLTLSLALTPIAAFGATSPGSLVPPAHSSAAPHPLGAGLPTVSLIPTSGYVESFVNVTGGGYLPSTQLNLTFGATLEIDCLGTTSNVTNATGNFTCMFTVPDTTAGTYLVNATDGANFGSGQFSVLLPTLSPYTASGHVGSFALSGTGFESSSLLTLTFGTTPISNSDCTTGGLTTNGTGSFACTFDIPSLTAGTYEIQASDAYNTGFANFTITAGLSLSPTSGTVGVLVSVTGTGFEANTPFTLAWNSSVTVCSGGATTGSGALSCSFTVPHNHGGPNVLTATAGSSSATKTFAVTHSFDFAPLTGPVGTSVDVLGVGYDASQAFNVTFAGTDQVCLSTTDTLGDLDCTFAVPASTQGLHPIWVHEGTSDDNETFTVNSSVEVTPSSGIAGVSPTVSGAGFGAMTTYAYCVESSETACPGGSGTFLTDAAGSIPSHVDASTTGLSPGVYDVVVSLGSTIEAHTQFTVTSAVLTILPTSGPVGSTVTLSGSMFLANQPYSYCFSASAGACPGASLQFTTDGSGNIPAGTTLVVPFATNGAYFVNVLGSGLLVADAGFELNASLALSPSSGTVGSVVVADGTGLFAHTAYLLTWAGSETVCTGATNSTGSFTCQFAIPATAQGSTIASASVDSLQPNATFTVLPSLALEPSSGTVGATLQASGEGYASDVEYSVEWNGSSFVCGGTTTNLGAFGCTGTVPAEPAGAYPVNGTDGPDYAVSVFTVVASVSLSATTGFAGSSITAGGAGFGAGQAYSVTWDASTQLCSGSTASDGTFSCTFTVPIAVGGAHTITASEGAFAPSTQFTLGASLSLSPSSGKVGASVTASGEGYAASGTFAVAWSTGAPLCSGTTQTNGAFSCRFTVPASPGGPFSVLADQGSSEAGAQFTVGPSVALGVPTGPVGTGVFVTGAGLSADTPVAVAWDNATTVCSGSANGTGGFACNFTVPWAAAGVHSISIEQGSPVATSFFTVVPALAANITAGRAGADVTLSGTGFDANSRFSVNWNSTTVLCAGTTNATGTFVCAFTVPPGAPVGPQAISVTQGAFSSTVTFTVASSPPPPTGAAPFPWWIVVVIALVVGLLLLLFIVGERQRRAAHHHHSFGGGSPVAGALGPSRGSGSVGSPSMAGSGPVSAGDLAAFDSIAGASAAAPASGEATEDIDAMIARLERMSEQLFKKKPADLGDVRTAQLPAEDEPPTN